MGAVNPDAPSWERRRQIASWLASDGRQEIIKYALELNHCVLATRVVVDLFEDYYSLAAGACPVQVYVLPPHVYARAKEIPSVLRNMPDKSRFVNLGFAQEDTSDPKWAIGAVGTGGVMTDTAWPGHVAALSGHTLIDLTIDQASRPHYGVDLDQVVIEVDDDWLDGTTRHLVEHNDCLLVYERTKDYRFIDAPDWMRPEAKALSRLLYEAIERYE